MSILKNILCLVVVLTVSLLFFSCETNRKEVMAIGKKVVMPSQTGKDITLLYSDSTILKIKLQAPQMQMYDKDVKQRVTIMPKGLFVIFYDENGKEATTLKANYGVRYEDTKRMEVKYNVEVVNAKGDKLNTEHLIWDEQKKKITSDAFVKITTAKEIIMGKGLEANQDFTQYEIKNIQGIINIGDEKL
jgi:LPS export ABC transporter protein LptC